MAKYKEKLEAVESELRNILVEEKEEHFLQKTEKKLQQCEQLLNKEKGGEKIKKNRSWFQTRRQRQLEKQKAKELFEAKISGKKFTKKRKIDQEQMEEEKKTQKKLQKLALQQAKMAKKSQKPRKIRAMADY